MKRYFVDCISEVNISDDHSVVSLVCSNFEKGKTEPTPDFQIVVPVKAFCSIAAFFESVNKSIGEINSQKEEKQERGRSMRRKISK